MQSLRGAQAGQLDESYYVKPPPWTDAMTAQAATAARTSALKVSILLFAIGLFIEFFVIGTIRRVERPSGGMMILIASGMALGCSCVWLLLGKFRAKSLAAQLRADDIIAARQVLAGSLSRLKESERLRRQVEGFLKECATSVETAKDEFTERRFGPFWDAIEPRE